LGSRHYFGINFWKDLIVIKHPHQNYSNPPSHLPWSTVASHLTDAWKFYCKKGEKIDAIKLYRVVYGCGLKEAKDGVEYYMYNEIFEDAKRYFNTGAGHSSVCARLVAAGISHYDAKVKVSAWVAEDLEKSFPR